MPKVRELVHVCIPCHTLSVERLLYSYISTVLLPTDIQCCNSGEDISHTSSLLPPYSRCASNLPA